MQVIKEGIGSKGPTLTSYISIPGRLLVMMPDMGRVGVSRKVEDEDERRSMRRMLDSLELPEGFGFIMRTAGYERSHSNSSAMPRTSRACGKPCRPARPRPVAPARSTPKATS